ncbi:MAG: phenylalanine--tRNA ligase subunit beta, partial [Gammaproteobacteria bacterium]|nr:phenylalanine--tRNA ligase subunit beta [Gammaproteobacteria bacterium]
MRISEAWLRERVNPPVDTGQLAEQLTMAGLEVGSVEPAAPDFSKVVLGRVEAVDPHPDADKLRVCQVNIGSSTEQIVCGASNIAAGQLVAVAEVGARLPGGTKIRKTKLRGVTSSGMVCSSTELGLGEDSEGILVLAGDGQPGDSLRDYLELDDQVLDIELTPNRGDCLGISGIAREVGVINRIDVLPLSAPAVPATIKDRIPVALEDAQACPLFAGRVVRGID